MFDFKKISELGNESFLKALKCPIGGDPLRDAVNLFPCCDKVNQVAAENSYGKMVDGFCELREKTCVICNTQVTGYAPDPLIRNIANHVFGPKLDLEVLPSHFLVLIEQEKSMLPRYPGIPGDFECTEDVWDEQSDQRNSSGMIGSLIYITLRNQIKNSVLGEFQLLGLKDGSIRLIVVFHEKAGFAEYLLAHQIVIDESRPHMFEARTPTEIKTLFHLVTINNHIPQDKYEKMREIIEHGSCKPYDPIHQPEKKFDRKQAIDSLPLHSLSLEEKKEELIPPYPGISADLMCKKDKWDKPFHNNGKICREMKFKSETEDSLLKRFELSRYRDGTIGLCVQFQINMGIEGYLNAYRLETNSLFENICFTRNPAKIKTLFQIIEHNNHIPEKKYEKVREIVERGSCEPYKLIQN